MTCAVTETRSVRGALWARDLLGAGPWLPWGWGRIWGRVWFSLTSLTLSALLAALPWPPSVRSARPLAFSGLC